jgi:hypothetical protein
LTAVETDDEADLESLALCVLDALWTDAAGSDGSAADVLRMYRELRAEDWGDAETDGITELAAQIEVVGGPAAWAERLKRRRPTSSTRVAIRNTTAMLEACELLTAAKVQTVAELRAASAGTLGELERSWKRMVGQRSGRSFGRLLLLGGVATPLPDRRPAVPEVTP